MHARNIVLVPIVHQAIRFDNCSFVMHVRCMILHEHHRTREENKCLATRSQTRPTSSAVCSAGEQSILTFEEIQLTKVFMEAPNNKTSG